MYKLCAGVEYTYDGFLTSLNSLICLLVTPSLKQVQTESKNLQFNSMIFQWKAKKNDQLLSNFTNILGYLNFEDNANGGNSANCIQWSNTI